MGSVRRTVHTHPRLAPLALLVFGGIVLVAVRLAAPRLAVRSPEEPSGAASEREGPREGASRLSEVSASELAPRAFVSDGLEAGDGEPEWSLRYALRDEQGRPIEGARATLDCSHVEGADAVATTGPDGVCEFHFPPSGDRHNRASSKFAAVLVEREGYADAREFLDRGSFVGHEGHEEHELVLQAGGRLRVFVADPEGRPAASAVVDLHLDEPGSEPSETYPITMVTSYRVATGAAGEVVLSGLRLGAWTASARTWRDWEGSQRASVVVESDATAQARLVVTRWTANSHASGRVESSLLAGAGGETCKDFHLRHAALSQPTLPQRTLPIYDDGAFFVPLADGSSEPWLLVRRDGEVCSAPVTMSRGRHAVTIVPSCPPAPLER
jgi:hypothetical protein